MNRYRRFDIKSIVLTLIITNVIVFFIMQINAFSLPESFFNALVSKGKSHVAFALQRYGLFLSLFSLFPVMIRDMGWLWQFFSYMFLHGNFLHLFFNMYVLLLFGRPLEQRWGWKEFLLFYCATGIGAGVFTYFWNVFTNPFIPTIGASGAIFAVVLAFGLEFPETTLLLFFLIPVKARYAAFIFGGIELVMILTGSMSGIGHFTHLAGLFFGFLYYVVRIRRKYGYTRWKIFKRSGRTVRKNRLTLATQKERYAQKAELLREKLNREIRLNASERNFLQKLKDAYDSNKKRICSEEEFIPSSEFCRQCEDYYACLYRYVTGNR